MALLKHGSASASLPSTKNSSPWLVWADLDYVGLSILAQIRRPVSARFAPYRMDVEMLEAHAQRAQPVLAENAHPLKRPIAQDDNPIGLFGLTSRSLIG